MKDVVAKRGKFWHMVNGLEPAGDEHGGSGSIKQYKDFDVFYADFFKDPGIDYAYLFAIDEDDPVNYLWVCMTRLPFALGGIESGFQARPEFMNRK